MCVIGIMPSLVNKPYMLERLQLAHNLVRVEGKHVHLVEHTMIKPYVKKSNGKPVFTPGPFNGGGKAA